MSRTKIRQVIQVANSETYDDAYGSAHVAGGAEPAHPELSIEHDLNVLRTNMLDLKGKTNWYDQISAGEDMTEMASDIDDLESAVGTTGDASGINYTTDYIVTDGTSTITAIGDLDGYLNTLTNAVASFTGMDAYGDLTPDYSSTNIITQNGSLETAISELDAYLSNVSNNTLQDVFNNSQAAGETSPELTLGADGLDITGTTGGFDVDTASGAISLDAGAASNFNTSAGDLTLSSEAASLVLNAATDVNIDGATLTGNFTGDGYLHAGGTNFDIATDGDLDLDGATVNMDATGAFSIDGGATSNMATSGGDLNIDSTAGQLNLDGATVDMTSDGAMGIDSAAAMTITAGAASTWSTSTGDLTVSAASELNLDGATVDINSTGALTANSTTATHTATTFDVDASSTMTLDTDADAYFHAGTTFDIDATGAMTMDSDAAAVFSGSTVELDSDGGNILLDASADIVLEEGSGSHTSTVTGGYVWTTKTSGTGDGYWQKLQDATAPFSTLQYAYDNGSPVDPDILIADGDEMNWKLGGDTASFKITNDTGDQVFRVTDGYVQVDGYFSVIGESFTVDSTINDADHWDLSPGLGSQTALRIRPKTTASVYTANLLEIWDGYSDQAGGTDPLATLRVSIDEDGDAYFADSVTIGGGTAGHATGADGDLYVSNKLEVDAEARFDALMHISSTGSFKFDHTSAVDGYVLTATDADGNAIWEPAGAVLGGDGLAFNGTTAELDVQVVPGETIIDTDRVGIDEAFSKTNFTSFTAASSGGMNLDATGTSDITVDTADGSITMIADGANQEMAFRSDDGYMVFDDQFTDAGSFGATFNGFTGGVALSTAATAWDAAIVTEDGRTNENIGILDAINATAALATGSNTLQGVYDNDPDGSDATITTNTTDGAVVIAGDQELRVTATGGLNVDTLIDFDGTTATFDASGAISLDAGATSNFTASAGDVNIDSTAGQLNLDGATVDMTSDGAMGIDSAAAMTITAGATSTWSTSAGDLTVSAASELNLDGATVDINSTGALTADSTTATHTATSTFDIDATGAMTMDSDALATFSGAGVNVHSDAGLLDFENTLAASVGSTDGYMAFDDGWLADAYYLSTGAVGWDPAIEAIDGRSGNNIGIIDAINAAAKAGSKSERAVYLITSDSTSLDLDTAADRGGVELGTSVGIDFRPGRDLEIYVNGVLQLQDDYDNTTHGGSVPTSSAATPEDDFFYANEATNGTLKFAFTLKSGDVVTVINRNSQAGEDTGTGWVAQ